MNVFGIDYGRRASLLLLREGDAPVRTVGDGERALVPHAAVAGGESDAPVIWGSRAVAVRAEAIQTTANSGALSPSGALPPSLQNDFDVSVAAAPVHADTVANDGDDLRPGPWINDTETALFWRGARERLYRYLGRMPPTEEHGYRVAVAITAGDNALNAIRAVTNLARTAGLNDVDVVAAADALLCAFLASGRQNNVLAAEADERNAISIVAVAVGDTGTEVAGYRLAPQASITSAPSIERAGSPVFLPFGESHWVARLLGELRSRLREAPPPGQDLLLYDAARAWGAALGRASVSSAGLRDNNVASPRVMWDGPLRERLYAPLRLSLDECLRDWPEACALVDQLTGHIREGARKAGAKNGVPDIVLIGGVGANWPFAAHAAASVVATDATPRLLWQGGEEAVARGATWWSEFGASFSPLADANASEILSAPHTKYEAFAPAAYDLDAPRDVPVTAASAPALAVAGAERTASPPAKDAPETAPDAPDTNLPPSLRRFDF